MALIVLMGSGETAPAMVKVHREVLQRTPPGPAVMLDTPYGFQVNADDLTHRTVRYFTDSVGRDVRPARWRTREEVAPEQTLTQISQASWVFAGPGSPTYALEQWRDTPMVGSITDVLRRDGTVVLGSAAAVTAGRWALPVYEIYKVGAAPHWVDGLDLMGTFLDLSLAVVPHFDNAEGGTYDTRFCYLGLERLEHMQAQLGPEGAVLGVDEHTAVIIDLTASSLEVVGSGEMSVRTVSGDSVVPAGSTLTTSEFADLVTGSAKSPSRGGGLPTPDASSTKEQLSSPPSLDADVSEQRDLFDAAMTQRDVDAAVAAILAVDSCLQAWAADTLQSDAIDRGRREIRAMVVRLGELARLGARDPRDVVGPIVAALLAARASARGQQDYSTSDLLRDVLVSGGVAVHDTAEGVTWTYHPMESADDEGPGPPP